MIENAEGFDSLEKPHSSNSTLVAESDYNSMENDKESDISSEIVVHEKDSGTDMVYSGEDLPPTSKVLRGRKKPTYVSPYRQQKNISRTSSNITSKQKVPSELIRQNTFVKDEPTNEDVPVVDVTGSNKLSSKIICAKSEEKPFVRQNKLNYSSIPKVYGPQRSNSTATIRVSPSIKLSRTNIPSTQPPSRSNSTLSKFNGNKLNQIGSKISGIWKNNKTNIQIPSSTNITNKKLSGSSRSISNDKQMMVNQSACIPQKNSTNPFLKVKLNSYQTSSPKYKKKFDLL